MPDPLVLMLELVVIEPPPEIPPLLVIEPVNVDDPAIDNPPDPLVLIVPVELIVPVLEIPVLLKVPMKVLDPAI